MRILLSILLTISPIMGYSQTLSKQAEFNSALGTDYESNLIKNPSAYKNINNVTGSGTPTVTRDTDAADQIDGKASFNISLDAGEYLEFDLNTPSSEQTVGNCGFKGIFKGNATPATVEIVDGSNNVLVDIELTNETDWREFKMWHPCGASGARKVRINNVTGPTRVINIGKLYYGRMEPGAGVPPNTFTAKVSTSGVVSDETGEDWLNGNFAVTDTSLFTGTFVTSKFSVAPTCTVSAIDPDTTVSVDVRLSTDTTTTTVVVRTGYSSTSTSFTKSAAKFSIRCTRSGSDYIQPAITPNQWNFGTRTTTPNWANLGFTPSTNVISYSRSGDLLIARGVVVFSSGTGSVSTLSLTLPEGLSIDTTKTGTTDGTQVLGHWSWYDDSGALGTIDDSFGAVEYNTSVSVRFRVPRDSGQFNTSVMATNDRFSFMFSVPIVGWTENQGAPQLVGSYTADDPSAVKTATWRSLTACSAGTCTKTSGIGSEISTVAFSATGVYNVTFSGLLNAPEYCGCNSVGASSQQCTMFNITSSTATLLTSTTAGAAQNYSNLWIKCDVKR